MWEGWSLARIILMFTGVLLLVVSVQVTLFHYRQNFRHWAMWGPVIGAPVTGVLAIMMALFNIGWLQPILAVILVLDVVSGLVGFGYHFEGVGERVDGYRMQNFLVGPPVTLPLMVSAMGVLGLLALYWRW
ncbi:hypothetical protein V6C27_09645 [Peptococcaceae bacterium 1198_IL3148]